MIHKFKIKNIVLKSLKSGKSRTSNLVSLLLNYPENI